MLLLFSLYSLKESGQKLEFTTSHINLEDAHMKKTLTISILLLLFVSTALAQTGIRAGLSIANFRGDDSKATVNPHDYDNNLPPGQINVEPIARKGFVAGLSYKADLLFGLSIQPEVLYIQKGAVYEIPSTPIPSTGMKFSGKMEVKLDYIEIPVLVKFSLPIPLLSPYVEGGLSYGILVSAKTKEEGTLEGVPGVGTQSGSTEADIKDQLTKGDLSLQLGVGLSILIVEVDVRYVLGFTKLYKDSEAKIYNQNIMLTACLRF